MQPFGTGVPALIFYGMYCGQKRDYHCCEYPFCIKNGSHSGFQSLRRKPAVGADRDNGVQKADRFRQMAVGDTQLYSQNQGQRTQADLQCFQNRQSSAIHPGTDEILVDAERKIRKQ